MRRWRNSVFARWAVVTIVCAFVGVIDSGVAVAQSSLPKQSAWAWIWTGPQFDKWESITGRAIVTVDGSAFAAKLFDAEDPTFLRFTVTGTISANRLKVHVVRENSDIGPYDLSGKLLTRSIKGFADYSAVQTIMLSNGFEQQLGLTRSLRE